MDFPDFKYCIQSWNLQCIEMKGYPQILDKKKFKGFLLFVAVGPPV